MRLASNVETSVEVSVSPESPDELAPQRRPLAQKTRIDVGKTSKAAAEKAAAVKFCFVLLVLVVWWTR